MWRRLGRGERAWSVFEEKTRMEGRTMPKLPRKSNERWRLPTERATQAYHRHSIQATCIPLYERVDEMLHIRNPSPSAVKS